MPYSPPWVLHFALFNMEILSSLDAFHAIQEAFNPDAEELWVVAMNAQMRMIGRELIFRGTVDRCFIHPRDIFRYAIQQNASRFLIAHNHPSLSWDPSPEDLKLTQRLHQLSEMIEIPMVDHIVFTPSKYFSFADRGLLRAPRKSKRTTSEGPNPLNKDLNALNSAQRLSI